MRILLIGGGTREHAVADALARSSHSPEIIAVSKKKNPGIARLASEYHLCDSSNHRAVMDIALSAKPDFCFIGPDDPIGAGLANVLSEANIRSVAPFRSAAQIESSKSFARNLMQTYNIDVSPKFRVFSSRNTSSAERKTLISEYIEDELHSEYVVKFDALHGGKGVKVSGVHLDSSREGVAYALECIDECGAVVIEEKLVGVEFSYFSFVSSSHIVHMPAVQDHKLAFEGDTGPNTGGMGTYSCADHSLPFLEPSDIASAADINARVIEALKAECGEPYIGILYGGYIAVRDGIRVIEFNARFGDPEALNLLSILSSDFVDICLSILDDTLNESLVTFERTSTVCKYLVPQSYPTAASEVDMSISVPLQIPDNVKMYTGDVSEGGSPTSLKLGTSRSIAMVGIADTVAKAEKAAESACSLVSGPVRWRSDIGTDSLINERIATLAALRGNKKR